MFVFCEIYIVFSSSFLNRILLVALVSTVSVGQWVVGWWVVGSMSNWLAVDWSVVGWSLTVHLMKSV